MGIEITSNVPLLRTGVKVGPSEAALLNMLNIRPFEYGFDILNVYDSGSVFDPCILDIGYPTIASVPHSIANGFKNLMAVAAVTDIEFPEVEQLKAFLADPSAFASAAPVEEAVAEETAAAAPAESSEESDDDMGFDMFG